MHAPYYTLLLTAALNSILSSFQYGYHMAVINIPEDILKNFVNGSYQLHYGAPLTTVSLEAFWLFVASMYTVGAIIGSLWSTDLAERYGRKWSLLLINSVIALVGSGLMTLSSVANSVEFMILGRLFIGINTGISSSVLPLYLTECSPIRYRGFIGSFQNVSICASILLANVLALPRFLGTVDLWPYLIGLGAVAAIMQLCLIPFVPETPKFLLLSRHNPQKARKSIRFYYGPRFDSEAILREIQAENQDASTGQIGLLDTLKSKDLRSPVLLSIVVNIGQPSTGISAILSFSTQMFRTAGLKQEEADYATVVMAAINLVSALIATVIVDRFGRRPLLLSCMFWDSGCCAIFLIFSLVGTYLNMEWAIYVSLLSVVLHVSAYNVGPGPISQFISSEVLPQAARSAGSAIGTASGFVMSLILTIIFTPVEKYFGALCFLLFIVPCTAVTVWLYYRMPETRNKTVDEIMIAWNSKQPNIIKPKGYDYFEEELLED